MLENNNTLGDCLQKKDSCPEGKFKIFEILINLKKTN